jgi:hypothetical protein
MAESGAGAAGAGGQGAGAAGAGGQGAGAAGAGGQGAGAGSGAQAIDYNAVYGTLSVENKEVFERKGFGKAGANGAPIDINGVFDWARNSEKLIGGDHIPAPRLDDDKAFNEWPGHEKLGVPKDAKDYKFERPQLPAGVQYDERLEGVFRTAISKAKIGQKQAGILFNELIADRVGQEASVLQRASEAKTAMETELRTTFGASLDAAMGRANLALRYIGEKAGVKIERAIDGIASLTGDGAAAIKVLHWIGQQLGEDVIKGGQGDGFVGGGPAAAKAEMDRLYTDIEFMKAYRDKSHQGHKNAVERMTRLAEQAGAKS